MKAFTQEKLLSILVLVWATFCVIAGAVVSFGQPIFIIGIFALVALPYALFLPLNMLLAFLLVLVFFAVGLLQYFAKFDQAHWLPYVILGAMLIRLPMEAIRMNIRSSTWSPSTRVIPIIVMIVLVFIVSALANRTGVMFVVVGAKSYILPFSLIGVLIVVQNHTLYWRMFWYSIPWLAIAQVPFVLFQHFVVAKRRATSLNGQISWDAVVGTFGGNQEGGGQSGAMALFLVFAVFVIFGLKKNGEVNKRLANVALLSVAVSIIFSEIKVVFVLIPLSTCYFYRRDLLARPLKAISSLLLIFAFVAAVSTYYKESYWTTEGRAQLDMAQSIDALFKVEGNIDFMNRSTGEVSRIGAPIIWWNENISKGDVLHALIGYGPSASRISKTVGIGEAAAKYPFMLTTNSISMMLWDLGLFGTGTFVTLLLFSLLRVAKMAKNSADVALRVRHEAAGVGLLCILVCLMYNQNAVDNSAIQVLWASLVGFASTTYVVQTASSLGRTRVQKVEAA